MNKLQAGIVVGLLIALSVAGYGWYKKHQGADEMALLTTTERLTDENQAKDLDIRTRKKQNVALLRDVTPARMLVILQNGSY